MRYAPLRTPSGATHQAGLPLGPPADGYGAAFLVRAVVMAVYVWDDPEHPFAARGPAAIYCDCLTYTGMPGMRSYLLRNVVVSYDHASIQGGTIAKPRATTGTVNGQPLNAQTVRSPAQLNGDHCIIAFLDDQRTHPCIIRWLPSPQGDQGHAADIVGRRARLRMVDGDPHFQKHHGTYFGVTDSGDFIADASGGNGGALGPGGTEAPSGTGSAYLRAGPAGAVKGQLMDPTGHTPLVEESLSAAGKTIDFKALPGGFAVTGAAGPVFAVAAGAAGAVPSPPTLKLGGGGGSLPSTKQLVAYLQRLTAWLATHTHQAAGPTSPTTPPIQAATVPATSEATLGNKTVSLPEA